MSGPGLAHNRRDALAAATRALARYGSASEASAGLFASALRKALSTASEALRERRWQLDRALADLAAAQDEQAAAACQRRVAYASEQVAIAESVVQTVQSSAEQFQKRFPTFTRSVRDTVLKGQSKLRTLDAGLDRYLAAGGGTGSVASSGGGTAGRGSLGNDGPSALARHGLEAVAVIDADFSDNPVVSWNKASRSDIEWAVDRWDTVVSKVVARGGSREELAERDQREGTAGTMRQLAGVWDMFLGSDPVTLSPRQGGGYDVVGGRHRLLVAREMGVNHLPARVLRGGGGSA